MSLLEVDSWARVYLAFYRTEGWFESPQRYDGVELDALSALVSGPRVSDGIREADADSAPASAPAPAVPILRYWTLRTPENQIIACDLVRGVNGLEVRLSSARAQAVRTMSDGLKLATRWRNDYEANGCVVERSAPPSDRHERSLRA